MDFNTFGEIINQYGYVALFFLLWLGIFGLPIPDELIVMGGGMLSLQFLEPITAFIVLYTGVMSGLTVGYGLGRWVGTYVLDYLTKKQKKSAKYIEKARSLVERYGTYSVCLSYLFPVVRHLVPYIVGMNRMPFRKFITYSSLTGLAWTSILFIIGRTFGYSIEPISYFMRHYGWMLLLALCAIGAIFYFIKTRRK